MRKTRIKMPTLKSFGGKEEKEIAAPQIGKSKLASGIAIYNFTACEISSRPLALQP
jgi:hypothetical protein